MDWLLLAVWAVPWLLPALIMWRGGWFDTHDHDRHYDSSGHYLGYTARKTGEVYIPPDPKWAVGWLIGYALVTHFTCGSPLKWWQDKNRAEAQRQREGGLVKSVGVATEQPRPAPTRSDPLRPAPTRSDPAMPTGQDVPSLPPLPDVPEMPGAGAAKPPSSDRPASGPVRIRVGMTKAEVRDALGSPESESAKSRITRNGIEGEFEVWYYPDRIVQFVNGKADIVVFMKGKGPSN